MKKIDTEYVKKQICKKGGKIDPNFIYKNSLSKIKIENCGKGHAFELSWNGIQQGYWCPKCSLKSKKEKIHLLGKKRIIKFIEAKGGKIDSNFIYKNSLSKIEIKNCGRGHSFKVRWNNLQQGSWCPICAKEKRRKENEKYIINLIEFKGGKIDPNFKYSSIHSKVRILDCGRGHTVKLSCSNLKMGQWCKKCSLKARIKKVHLRLRKRIIKYIEANGGKIDPNFKYQGAFAKFIINDCGKGHSFKTSWDALSKKFVCPECKLKEAELKIKKLVEHKGGSLDSNFKYKGKNYKKFKVVCNKGHKFKINRANLQNDHWCPNCYTKTQEKFRKVIEGYFNNEFPTRRPKFLVYPKTERRLELDGYNKKLKIAFEYQGWQHRKKSYYGGKTRQEQQEYLKGVKERDEFKVKQCKKKEILLIVVSDEYPKHLWKFLIKKRYYAHKGSNKNAN